MSVLVGMTGAGKSVWVRRAVRELMEKQYPILIFDPHGDNLGIVQKAKNYFLTIKSNYFTQKFQLQK